MVLIIQIQQEELYVGFNWYHDVQVILRNRKLLPRGIYVNEDLPEDWVDRCRVLKPIFNAAKKKDSLKYGTFFEGQVDHQWSNYQCRPKVKCHGSR